MIGKLIPNIGTLTHVYHIGSQDIRYSPIPFETTSLAEVAFGGGGRMGVMVCISLEINRELNDNNIHKYVGNVC